MGFEIVSPFYSIAPSYLVGPVAVQLVGHSPEVFDHFQLEAVDCHPEGWLPVVVMEPAPAAFL